MRVLSRSIILPVLALVFGSGAAGATTLEQLNLAELCERGHQVFRGTIVSVTAGTVTAGGSELPTVTYRIRVDEAFQGDFVEINGRRFAEVRMLGAGKRLPAAGEYRRVPLLSDMPVGKSGQDVLFFTTRPSSVGLSTTVGLGQGWFDLSGGAGKELAVNRYNNEGLFSGLNRASVSRAAGADPLPPNGPVPYEQLSEYIRLLIP
jgi:hypothetical protein